MIRESAGDYPGQARLDWLKTQPSPKLREVPELPPRPHVAPRSQRREISGEIALCVAVFLYGVVCLGIMWGWW